MDYSNPMGGLANPSDFAASPFLQAQQAYLKNDMAIPLIQAQQKMSLLEGLQSAQKVSEFMSPEQRQARQAKTQDEIAGYQHSAAKRPLELTQMGLANDTAKQALEEKAAKLKILLRDDAAAPAREMYSMLGQRAMQIKALPPAARAMAWDEMVREIRAKTGQDLPENLRTFNPNSLRNGEIAFMASVDTPQNIFTARENKANRDNQLATANIGASATRYAADQANERERLSREERAMNTDQRLVTLARQINDPKTSEADRENLRREYMAHRRRLIVNGKGVTDQISALTLLGKSQAEISAAVENFIKIAESNDTLLPSANPNPAGQAPAANATPEEILNFWRNKNK